MSPDKAKRGTKKALFKMKSAFFVRDALRMGLFANEIFK